MPELPEVETIVRELKPQLVGRRFGKGRLSHDDVLRGVTRRKLIAGLDGATVVDVTRRAKHAVFVLQAARRQGGKPVRSATLRAQLGDRLGDQHSPFRLAAFPPFRLVVQPGMTGSLIVYDRALDRDEARYAVLRLPLDDGRELVYRDVRRLGTILLLDDKGWESYDRAIGPEPLNGALSDADFLATLRSSRQAIKKVLMDQRKLAGVGNIYANEALFAAGIDPSRAANRITPEEAPRLLREVRRILDSAIRSKGTTFRDYRTGTGERGNFQFELLVYGREGEPCRVCGTRLAHTHDIDGRITVFCHRCQR